jgi:hypothetical protein
MFSANENIQLRQYKKRVVEYVESTIPDPLLDAGVNVMAMQIQCKTPGCVPIETAIIVIFPRNDTDEELLVGLPESANGGSYKTKVLKPLSDVTREDVLAALPPAFKGGTRTLEKLCIQARDVMFGQITQLFGDSDDQDITGRQLMVQYLQESLQRYIENQYVPPAWGEPFPSETRESTAATVNTSAELSTANSTTTSFARTGNIILPRPTDDDHDVSNSLYG